LRHKSIQLSASLLAVVSSWFRCKKSASVTQLDFDSDSDSDSEAGWLDFGRADLGQSSLLMTKIYLWQLAIGNC